MNRLRLWVWLWRSRLTWWHRRKPGIEMPMRLYVGLPGSGKTLLAVTDGIRMMRRGRRVASNMRIIDRLTGLEAEPCGSWLDMLRLTVDALERHEPIMFVWDELHLSCDARSWASTPAWWLALIAQRRHYGVSFIGTTQAVDQIEKRLRTLVDYICLVRPAKGSNQALVVALGGALVGGLIAAGGAFSIPGYALELWSPWWGVVPLFVCGLTALLVVWKPLPVFSESVVDAASIDRATVVVSSDGKGASAGIQSHGYMPRYVPWFAFAGYSTRELMLGDDFSGYKDEEVVSEIADLTNRAIAALAPGARPECFADVISKRPPADEDDGCSVLERPAEWVSPLDTPGPCAF